MEIVDKQAIRSKSFAIRSVMKDPKLSKTLFDAWDAPAGSTRNAKARAILKSLNLANSNYGYVEDGQGGILDWAKGLFQKDQSGLPAPNFSSGNAVSTPAVLPNNEVPAPAPQPLSQAPGFKSQQFPSNFAQSVDHLLDNKFKPGQEMSVAEQAPKEDESPAGMLEKLGTIGQTNLDTSSLTASPISKSLADYQPQKWTLPWMVKGAMVDTPKFLLEKGVLPLAKDIGTTARDVAKYGAITGETGAQVLKSFFTGLPKEAGPLLTKEAQRLADKRKKEQEQYKELTKWKTKIKPEVEEEKVEVKEGEEPVIEQSRKDVIDFTINRGKEKGIDLKPEDVVELINKDQAGETINDITLDEVNQRFTSLSKEEQEAVVAGATSTQDPTDVESFSQLSAGDQVNILNADPSAKEYLGTYTQISDAITDYGSLEAAVQAGAVTQEMFTFMLLEDPQFKADAFGVPLEVAKQYPSSPFMAQQIIDLKNAKKKEFELEEKEKKIKDLENRGLSIEYDLQSYIRGKDQYLGDIDKLLDSAYDSIANMDTSNPYVAQRMKNYLNYLTILKGKQNQRYSDMLGNSINYHDAELKRAQSEYEFAFNKASEAFEEEKLIDTERHDWFMKAIEGLYSNITNRNQLAIDKEDREFKLMDDAAKRINDSLDRMIKEQKLLNPDVPKMTKSDRETIENRFGHIDESGYEDQFVFDVYDPWRVVKEATTAGQGDKVTWDIFLSNMDKSIKENVNMGNFLGDLSKFQTSMGNKATSNFSTLESLAKKEGSTTEETMKNIETKIENNEELTADEFAAVGSGAEIITMNNRINDSIREGVRTFLLTNIEELRDAIKYLAKTKKYNKGKDNFTEDYSELGDVAPVLYDFIKANVDGLEEEGAVAATPQNVINRFGYEQEDDDSLANDMSMHLSNYLMPAINF